MVTVAEQKWHRQQQWLAMQQGGIIVLSFIYLPCCGDPLVAAAAAVAELVAEVVAVAAAAAAAKGHCRGEVSLLSLSLWRDGIKK